jgi:peptide/nickel transport system substrate-binding protein
MVVRGSRRWLRLLAVLAVFGLLASACGSDDSDGSEEGGGETSSGAAEGDPDEGETPIYGGSVVFAREAETSSPWTPGGMVCDLSCHQAIHTVYDTLTYTGADDVVHPFLLESFEPNEDFTVWTLTPREGIQFHDDTPFDADAVAANLDHIRNSFLTGRSLGDIEGVVAGDDGTVEVTMSRPWAAFPAYLAGQPGYVASPTWLAAVEAGEA